MLEFFLKGKWYYKNKKKKKKNTYEFLMICKSTC